MNVDLRNLGKGSFDVGIGVTSSDIEALAAGLQALKQRRDHLHIRSNDSEERGIEDIEIYWAEDDSPGNMVVDTLPPLDPTR
jgi:hypothetical protein